MIADTGLLLALRWQIAWNGFVRLKPARKVLSVIGVLYLAAVGVGLCGAIGLGAGVLLRRYPELQLASLLPGLILTAIALILVLTSFGMALGALFLSGDLDLLMSAPVDRRAVFLSKILGGLGVDYAIIAVTALPALVTYGIGLHYGPLYYALVVLALLGTPLLPAGLGALLVMLVARFAPARRVREVLGLVAALFGISCSLIGQTSRVWMRQVSSVNPDLQALKAQVQAVAALPVPSLVAGRGLAAAGAGDWAGALAGLAGFGLLTFGFFALCVWLAGRLYATGWVRLQSSGSAARSPARVARDAAHSGWLGRAPQYLAIALKDWRMLPRDLRNFAQILGPLILLPVVYFNLLGGAGRRSFNALQAAQQAAAGRLDPTGIFIAAGILLSTVLICQQISSTAISVEGKAWWLIKAAPISGTELARGKYLAAALPYAILSSLLLAGAALWKGFSLLGFLYGWYGIEVLGLAILAVSLGCAMRWPRLDWDDPRRMHSGWATFFSFVGLGAVGLIGGGLLCLPALSALVAPGWALSAWALGLVGPPLVAAGAAAAALHLGLAHLPDVGEA